MPGLSSRGGCTPGNSRCVAARDNSRQGTAAERRVCARGQRTCAGVAPQAIRANGSSLPLVLIERIAHVRGGCTPGKSRQWQLAALVLIKRPTRVRGGCTPGKSRLGQRATARAHRKANSRARRRRVKFFAQLSTKESWRVVGQRPTVLVASASAGEAKNVPVGHF